MVEHELTVGRRTVQRLLAIAYDDRLATRVSRLPPAWGAIYALTRLPDATFTAAIADGKIHPEMTRDEAEALMPRPQPMTRKPAGPKQRPEHQPAGGTVPEPAYPPEQTPPPTEHQPERAIADALVELAALVDTCDVAVVAALLRGKPDCAPRVARFLQRLELAFGGWRDGGSN